VSKGVRLMQVTDALNKLSLIHFSVFAATAQRWILRICALEEMLRISSVAIEPTFTEHEMAMRIGQTVRGEIGMNARKIDKVLAQQFFCKLPRIRNWVCNLSRYRELNFFVAPTVQAFVLVSGDKEGHAIGRPFGHVASDDVQYVFAASVFAEADHVLRVRCAFAFAAVLDRAMLCAHTVPCVCIGSGRSPAQVVSPQEKRVTAHGVMGYSPPCAPY
jgi:hypothetical protein